ncbi:Putative tRNA (guanine-N1-)-methyltransferase, tRNA methyltransferase TRMD/TRM10-type [Septoria linicola]|uniref:tRNA (guanine(9)-N1)-methyltransferase n=1 Tax=Septoria linicola TaxID=215465 RepID=A0A9Q9ERV8_9PEZI|nr:putative tRNA (guanine-N1-)-methyltransferase, tRNA methyltransferase TRMD/TRM10-type [Septoria linicola]USW58968.1 Putative tRNA (guanine-N1-)-methyltransferase, tRNA methyltransferase TRMD/TRM10-type [Septoria linicola]
MESEERPSKIRKIASDTSESLPNAESTLTEQSSTQNQQNGEEPSLDSENASGQGGEEARPSEADIPVPDTIAPLASTSANSADPPISKSQQKKLKRKAEWEAKRGDRKIERKAKLQVKRERKREEKQQAIERGIPLPRPTKAIYKRATQLPITFMIDCDFDDLMHDGERTSLGSQVTRSYSDNKNAPYRAHLTICSFGGKLKERFDTVLSGQHKLWKGVRTLDTGFVETALKAKEWMQAEDGGKLDGVFAKYAGLDDEAKQKLKDEGEIVYLSSEANEDLLELKPYSTYIIGGLVDKNREKGICHRRATKAGIKTAKLPIGEYMDMASRKVLATNHVNEILVKWLESGDWAEAFFKVMPKRKGGKLKEAKDDEEDYGEDDQADTGGDDYEHEEEVVKADENVMESAQGDATQNIDATIDQPEEGSKTLDVVSDASS